MNKKIMMKFVLPVIITLALILLIGALLNESDKSDEYKSAEKVVFGIESQIKEKTVYDFSLRAEFINENDSIIKKLLLEIDEDKLPKDFKKDAIELISKILSTLP